MSSTWSFSQSFTQQFQASSSDLETRFATAQKAPSVSREQLQAFSLELSDLAKDLGDATGSLPSYEQRKYEQRLKGLENTLYDLQTQWTPKPKFAFKRKAAPPSSSTPSTNRPEARGTVRSMAQATQITATQNPKLSSQSYRYLATDSLAITDAQHDLTISDLDHCVVNLISGHAEAPKAQLNISALHIRNLTDTILLLPRINGSVLIHDLSRCTIVLGCHQFRMHTSRHVDVYLYITSNPVIEHSSAIRFSSYPSTLNLLNNNDQPNQCYSVLDFSHIRSTPSPNWSILPEDIRQWVVNPADNHEKMDDILQEFLPT